MKIWIAMDTENKTDYTALVKSQLDYFNTNITKDLNFRIANLKKFIAVLKANEDLLDEAIYKDFRKSRFENYATELSLVYHEINLAIKNLKSWSGKNCWNSLKGVFDKFPTLLESCPHVAEAIAEEQRAICKSIGCSKAETYDK